MSESSPSLRERGSEEALHDSLWKLVDSEKDMTASFTLATQYLDAVPISSHTSEVSDHNSNDLARYLRRMDRLQQHFRPVIYLLKVTRNTKGMYEGRLDQDETKIHGAYRKLEEADMAARDRIEEIWEDDSDELED